MFGQEYKPGPWQWYCCGRRINDYWYVGHLSSFNTNHARYKELLQLRTVSGLISSG